MFIEEGDQRVVNLPQLNTPRIWPSLFIFDHYLYVGFGRHYSNLKNKPKNLIKSLINEFECIDLKSAYAGEEGGGIFKVI